ncbi:hypothetical protein [Lewinella sp. IMCC34183]|uniref:hypothetical protein n=1 Tax=Lewinella sp. IMCC34183 TaxID=2248762 RepID=UPI000E285407|nr:hypothetical protein [Lewinella sp. IMCC34183]
MNPSLPDLPDLTRDEKLHLLEQLLNGLARDGVISNATLMTVATDVMELDYRNDDDLLCFQCLDNESPHE